MNRIKVCIIGATGRFGSTIIKELGNDFELVGAVAAHDNEAMGKKLGDINVILHGPDSLTEAIGDADVVISVTNPNAELENVSKIARARKKLVIGTTGFTEEQSKTLRASTTGIATLISSNFSIGMNFVFSL